MARQFIDQGASRQELDRFLRLFSQLDDASVEDEHHAISFADVDDCQKRPKARLSQPVLKTKDIQPLLDGARQSRAFSKRLCGES